MLLIAVMFVMCYHVAMVIACTITQKEERFLMVKKTIALGLLMSMSLISAEEEVVVTAPAENVEQPLVVAAQPVVTQTADIVEQELDEHGNPVVAPLTRCAKENCGCCPKENNKND